MALSIPHNRMLALSAGVEFTGSHGSFPEVLRVLSKYGIIGKVVEVSAADPAALTLFFYEGDESSLRLLQSRKSAERLVVVSANQDNSRIADEGIKCFVANNANDSYEIARYIFAQNFRMSKTRFTPSGQMMRRFFRYAVRLLT